MKNLHIERSSSGVMSFSSSEEERFSNSTYILNTIIQHSEKMQKRKTSFFVDHKEHIARNDWINVNNLNFILNSFGSLRSTVCRLWWLAVIKVAEIVPEGVCIKYVKTSR